MARRKHYPIPAAKCKHLFTFGASTCHHLELAKLLLPTKYIYVILLWTIEKVYHGNRPTSYAISPEGLKYRWNGNMMHGGSDPWELDFNSYWLLIKSAVAAGKPVPSEVLAGVNKLCK